MLASRTVRLVVIVFMGLLGAVVGMVVNVVSNARQPQVDAAKDQVYPLPHHVPKYPGGVALRFAMAHDVIHERFPWHGKAYYEERNRRARQAIDQEDATRKTGAKPTQAYWDLQDDLAVGLDRLGKHEEAVALMRDKLRRQQELGLTGRDLYASYANLGTFLILWQIDEGFADKDKAKQRIKESVQLIHKAIEVKPDAHFGREIWQAVLEEFILAVLDNPELLLKYDMVGNSLQWPVPDPGALRSFEPTWTFRREQTRAFLGGAAPKDPKEWQARAAELREDITRVGAEARWAEEVPTAHKQPVPFDEPTLGIIGMWRYGAGANPHFALGLGEIMLRVGQRYIAWCAYERAASLAGGLGPEPIPQKFVEHCRRRQKIIEGQLTADETGRLRSLFDKELAHGKAYQQAYQQYEEERIKAGDSIDDPHFYDLFHTRLRAIASPVGPADQYVVESPRVVFKVSYPLPLLFAGLFAFATAGLLWYAGRRA